MTNMREKQRELRAMGLESHEIALILAVEGMQPPTTGFRTRLANAMAFGGTQGIPLQHYRRNRLPRCKHCGASHVSEIVDPRSPDQELALQQDPEADGNVISFPGNRRGEGRETCPEEQESEDEYRNRSGLYGEYGEDDDR